MKPKTVKWNFRTSDDLIERLNRAAEITEQPAAQIVRDAIREKLEQLAQQYPAINGIQTAETPAAAVAA